MKTIFEKLAMCQSAGEIQQMLAGNDHAVVPKQPTDEMLKYGSARVRDFYSEPNPYSRTRAMYHAMIAAAEVASPIRTNGEEK